MADSHLNEEPEVEVEGGQKEQEVVASGELYKQTISDSKTWVLRHFTLQGVYLSYSTSDGTKKGQIDITDCKLKLATPEECNNMAAKFAFAIITKKKVHYLCSTSERNRVAWMIIIHEQAEANRSFRRHLHVGEQVVTSKKVKRREINENTNVLLIATNIPRVLVVHPINNNLMEEIKWDSENPSVFEAVRYLSYLK